MPTTSPNSFKSNLLSGLFLSLTSMPQICTYSHIIGYSPLHALRTAGIPIIIFSLITDNPNLVIGVTAVTAVLTKSNLEFSYNNFTPQEYISHVGAYSALTGIISLILALLGFPKLARKVPDSVKAGFKWGCAVGIIGNGIRDCISYDKKVLDSMPDNNIGKLLVQPFFASLRELGGSKMSGSKAIEKLFLTLTNYNYWDLEPVVIFLLSCLLCKYGRKLLLGSAPKGTEVILSTFGGTVFSYVTSYENRGGAIVGVQEGLSSGQWQWLPTLEFHNPVDVLSSENFLSNFNGSLGSALFSALVFTMVNFLSIVAISSHFESDPGLSRAWVSPTKDLIAQGVACLSSGLIGGGPIGGSLSRSLVSVILGATSYVSSISAGLTLLLLVNFVGGLLTFTPITSLAALVVCAVGVEVLLPKDLLKLGGAGNKVVGWWTGIVTMLYNPSGHCWMVGGGGSGGSFRDEG